MNELCLEEIDRRYESNTGEVTGEETANVLFVFETLGDPHDRKPQGDHIFTPDPSSKWSVCLREHNGNARDERVDDGEVECGGSRTFPDWLQTPARDPQHMLHDTPLDEWELTSVSTEFRSRKQINLNLPLATIQK